MNPLYAHIYKVDESTREVTGRATQEVTDRDGEVMDYRTSKPEFMRWSAEVFKDSGGKSHGNVRSMHGNTAAGKLTDIQFLDDERAIDVTAKIVDNNEWGKILEGVYAGFSIGGRYARKWSDVSPDGKVIQRYTAVPSEISIVDRPSCPAAKFFTVHKIGGEVMKKRFKNSGSEFVSTMNRVQALMAASGMTKNTSDIDAIRKIHARGPQPLPGDFLYKFDAPSKHKNQDAANALMRKRVRMNAGGSRLRKGFPPQDSDIRGGSIANTGAGNDWKDQPTPAQKPTRIGNQVIGAPSRTNMQAAIDALKQDFARGAKRMGA
jgi:hypothetical protein